MSESIFWGWIYDAPLPDPYFDIILESSTQRSGILESQWPKIIKDSRKMY